MHPSTFSPIFGCMVHRRCYIWLPLFSLSTFMPWPLTSHAAWLLACSCLATTTTTTMAINTLALHCTTLHMTPFIGMHGWVHVCKCLLCLCPDVLEEIQLTGSIVSLSPWPGSGSGRPAPLQDACCYHAPTDSPFVPPCPKPSGC